MLDFTKHEKVPNAESENKKEKGGLYYKSLFALMVVMAILKVGDMALTNPQAEADKIFRLQKYENLKQPGSNENFGDIRFDAPEGYSIIIKNGDTLNVKPGDKIDMDIIRDNVKVVEDNTGKTKDIVL